MWAFAIYDFRKIFFLHQETDSGKPFYYYSVDDSFYIFKRDKVNLKIKNIKEGTTEKFMIILLMVIRQITEIHFFKDIKNLSCRTI